MYNKAFENKKLDTKIVLPRVKEGFVSSWAQYTIQLPQSIEREKIQMALKEKDIPTMVYYMKPMHMQGAFKETDSAIAECPVTEEICNRVLSLPMHPYMTEENVNEVVNALAELLF